MSYQGNVFGIMWWCRVINIQEGWGFDPSHQPSQSLGVESACPPRATVGSLQVPRSPPTDKRKAFIVS